MPWLYHLYCFRSRIRPFSGKDLGMQGNSGDKTLESMIKDVHRSRMKNAAFHYYHSQMVTSDVGRDIGEVARDLRRALNYLCTYLCYHFRGKPKKRQECNSFPFFTGGSDDRDIDDIFENFKREHSLKLFGKEHVSLNERHVRVLKELFKFQPVTQVLNGKVQQRRDNSVQINVHDARWLHTLRVLRNDVEHHGCAEVIEKDVDGKKLLYIKLPVTTQTGPSIENVSIVVSKWIHVVTQIITNVLTCIATPPETYKNLSKDYVSWNYDVIIVNGRTRSWEVFLQSVQCAKGYF